MNKYHEDDEDLMTRLLLEYGKPIMDSLQVGDHFTITSCYDEDDNGKLKPETIELCNILSKKRFEAISSYCCFCEDEDEDQATLEIPRLFVVTQIYKGIPIYEEVKFPGEDHQDKRKYSLAYTLYNSIQDEFNGYCVAEDCINMLQNFIKIDSNYTDSILLDSTFVPYENYIQQVRDLEEIADKKYKEIKRMKAARARREKREEDRMWKEEFYRVVYLGLKKTYKE